MKNVAVFSLACLSLTSVGMAATYDCPITTPGVHDYFTDTEMFEQTRVSDSYSLTGTVNPRSSSGQNFVINLAPSTPGTFSFIYDANWMNTFNLNIHSYNSMGGSSTPAPTVSVNFNGLVGTAPAFVASAAYLGDSSSWEYGIWFDNPTASFSFSSITVSFGDTSGTALPNASVSIDTSSILGTQTAWTGNAPDHAVMTFTPVPEPSTYALLGLASLGLIARWRRN